MITAEIDLTEKESDFLAIIAKQTGKTQSDVIREAVEGFIAEFDRQVSEESSRHKKIQALKGKYAYVKTDSEGKGTDMTLLTKPNEMIEYLTEMIASEPENAILYWNRAGCYFLLKSYEKALEDCNKAIEIYPKNADFYLGRGICYFFLKSHEKAIKDYNKAIELNPENAICYSNRGTSYSLLESYEKALEDHNKAIELEPTDGEFYFCRGNYYLGLKSYEKAIKDYNKAIELDPKNENIYNMRMNCYLALKSNEKALEDYKKVIELIPNSKPLANLTSTITDNISEYLNKRDEESRFEERNKIFADLSHSIKNLIGTVIDPLENLKSETVVQPQIIQNALRGANLIREIVNAVNLSFKGSMDDFVYDAQHNAGKDSVNLESMLIESLKQSVGNMFDSKYLGDFTREYFPKREQYFEAKAKWMNISQSKDLKSLEQFLKSYFFETDFSFENAKSYAIGNQKYSAVKLLILFQELILNAVKYSAFVSKEKRFIRIRFISNADTISVNVENPFKRKAKTKTTGIGHVMIENIAKLLNTEPVISKENSEYCVVIQFNNLWKGNAQWKFCLLKMNSLKIFPELSAYFQSI